MDIIFENTEESALGIARKIEHTLLRPDARLEEIETLCRDAIDHRFIGACVPTYFVPHAHKLLEGTEVNLVTVIGFPYGYSPTNVKVAEARTTMENGADELDMVINMAAFKSGDIQYVKNDIQSIVTAAHLQNKKVKVIVETGIMNDEELQQLCGLCAEAEADFVKTSTGVLADGITPETVKKLRQWLPEKIKIKAVGGVRTHAQAIELIEAGADRIGSSHALDLLN